MEYFSISLEATAVGTCSSVLRIPSPVPSEELCALSPAHQMSQNPTNPINSEHLVPFFLQGTAKRLTPETTDAKEEEHEGKPEVTAVLHLTSGLLPFILRIN